MSSSASLSSVTQGECGQVSEVLVESVNGELLVSVSEQLHLTWSTTTHMTLLTLGQEVMAFVRSIRPPEGERERERETGCHCINSFKLFLLPSHPDLLLPLPSVAEVEAGPPEGTAAGAQEEGGGEEQGGLKLQVLARGDVRIGAELSHRHHICFILGESWLLCHTHQSLRVLLSFPDSS